jgi:ATP-dependent helicase/DNAse subunit B
VGSKVFTSACLQTLERACLTGLIHIQREPLTPVFVVVPGNLLALHLRRGLARAHSPGHANIRFLTLVDFASEIAENSFLSAGARAVTPLAEEILLRKAIAETVPAQGYFARVMDHATFGRSLSATLADLREALIEPAELESWAARFPEPKEGGHKLKELARIYSRYRSLLKEIGLFDRNDLLERAANILEREQVFDFELIFYGFYDFNPLQRKLVERLLKKKPALFFLPWIDGAAFDYALPTLTWLKNLGCERAPLEKPEGAGGEQPLAALAEAIFSSVRPKAGLQKGSEQIEILSAPGEAREAAEIARRCLKWVKERGFSFSEIAILLRSLEPYAEILAHAFTHAGIPFYLQGGAPLWQSREGRSLRLLFKILKENWSRASVMEFITFAPLAFGQAASNEVAQASTSQWELLSAQAGIAGGKEEWRERLQRLMAGEQTEAENLEAFIRFMDRLIEILDSLPRRGPWSDMALKLNGVIQRLFAPSEMMQKIVDEIEKLAAGDALEEEIDLERFAQGVESALASARASVGSFGREGVFIGEVMSARAIPFKGVIVAGMVERLFPLKHRQDPVLLDRERQYLSETLKKELDQKERGFDEERLLFTLTLMSAQARALFSFPRLEPFTARERIPSFFLLRLMEALTGKAADFSAFEEWPVLERVPLSRLFPRSGSEALTVLEYDLRQADLALEEKTLAPLDYLARLSPFFSRSLLAEAKRWGERRFTEFDGVLASRKSRAALERYLAKRELTFAPTALETYARCPHRFFLQSLLRLSPWEEADRLAGLAPVERGELVHRILFPFYSRLKQEGRLPLAGQERTDLEALLIAVAEETFRAFEAEKATGYPLLWSLEKRAILESLLGFLNSELKDDKGFVPAYFERGFRCSFPLNGKGAISLRGRIDRVDLSPDGRRGRIIDYKSGQVRPVADGEFNGGEALQLPLYLYAASRELGAVEFTEAAYAYVSEKAGYKRFLFTTSGWQEKLKTLKKIVSGLVGGIRRGIYPPRPHSCRPCPFPLICGHAAQTLYERKIEDARVAFLERIKEIP